VRRDEWLELAATEPATSDQVGAIHREFARLGYREAERAGRLAASAALLCLDGLDSSADLTLGEAGKLVRLLQGFTSRAELAAELSPAVPWWHQLQQAIARALS
jgi:hypothetical protein